MERTAGARGAGGSVLHEGEDMVAGPGGNVLSRWGPAQVPTNFTNHRKRIRMPTWITMVRATCLGRNFLSILSGLKRQKRWLPLREGAWSGVQKLTLIMIVDFVRTLTDHSIKKKNYVTNTSKTIFISVLCMILM
jgi:hypothetical protein